MLFGENPIYNAEAEITKLKKEIADLQFKHDSLQCYIGTMMALLIAKGVISEDEVHKITEVASQTYVDWKVGVLGDAE